MGKEIALGLALACAGLATGAPWPTPDYLRKATVYQVVLRNFTRDGNFKAATEMLDHVRGAGVDVVYLAPFVEMDCDMDESGWSNRQKKSGYGSPKNAYRISNYDKIDPEYGNDDDFKRFNDRAHALGMKVYMDLVYLHCGPNNVLKDLYADAFQKTNGVVRTTIWHFPYVNFDSKGVRKYLIDSMQHWIRLGCDGFRCDVGDLVPIDFWEEAVAACRQLDPELVMINEGTKEEWLRKAFDACYAWPWSFTIRHQLSPKSPTHGLARGKTLAEQMKGVRAYEKTIPDGALMFCFLDNHDTATDDWDDRFDRINPVAAGNAAFVLTFLRRGLPLLFNGNEIADNARNSFFAPVEHPCRAAKIVDWARAVQPAGQERLALVRRLAQLHREEAVFYAGAMDWITAGEAQGVVAFVRSLGARRVLVMANLTARGVSFTAPDVSVAPEAKSVLQYDARWTNGNSFTLGPWGYLAVDVK